MLLLMIIAIAATSANTLAEVEPVTLTSQPYVMQQRDNAVLADKSTAAAKSIDMVAVIKDVLSTVLAMLSNLIRHILVFILNNAVVVLISSFITLAVCNFTSACTYINDTTPFRQIQITIKYFATPNMIMQAADFVYDAIKKYADMQKEGL